MLARLADLAHRVQVLWLEAALIVEGDEGVVRTFEVEGTQLAVVIIVIKGAVIGLGCK